MIRLTELSFKQEPYKWTLSKRDIGKITHVVNYEFKNKLGTIYTVEIAKYYGEDDVDVLFAAIPVGKHTPTVDRMINDGDVIKVMSTIVSILKSYFKDNPETNQFKFTAMKSPSENEDDTFDNKRAKLYIAVAKAHGITNITKIGKSTYIIKIK